MFSDSPPTPEDVAAWKADQLERQAHYAAIGRVAANWTYFEYEIDHQSIALAGFSPPLAACLTAQISGHGRKLDAYIALADLRDPLPAHMSALHKLAMDAKKLSIRRNRVVHDPWFMVAASTQARRFEISASKKLIYELVHYPTPKVERLAEEIGALTRRFCTLAIEIQSARDASPETPAGDPAQ